MTNDEILAAVIRLIKAGKREAAQSILDPFLLKNPNHIQAWMWKAELFPNDQNKIEVLEACLKQNPGNPQAAQALNFLKSRSGSQASKPSASPFTAPSSASPFTEQPAKKPSPPPFTDAPSAKPTQPFSDSSPFSTSPFLPESDSSSVANKQAKEKLPQFETAQPEQQPQPVPEKKIKGKHSKTTDILIIAGVCLLFAVCVGGYIAGGFYINKQIDQSFVAQKCKDVVQHSTFVSLYPQIFFSSTFTGYDQYTQCGLKLGMEQSVETKDWGGVLSFTQEYLAVYPQGAFAADMNEKAIDSLLNWSKDLIADKNYGSGIEKLQQLVKAYPTLPTVESVRDNILETYFIWVKDISAQKNYAESEQKLKSALSYFESDAARSEKIKAELVKVYVSWGNSQVEIGNMDNALKYYQQAGDLSQGEVDVNLLIAKAYLEQALVIADKEDFNRALSKVQEVEKTAQADNVKAEVTSARETILKKYSESDSIQAAEQIKAAIPLVCGGQRLELPIFGHDEKNIRFGLFSTIILPLPKELTAETPAQLYYAVCVKEEEKEIGSCPYTLVSGGGKAVLYRLRYEWLVTVYGVMTGEVINSETFKGDDPPACKVKEPFTKGVKYKKSYGSKPTIDQVAVWIQELGIAK